MNLLTPVENDEKKNDVSDQQQSPIISTLEQREEVEKVITELLILPLTPPSPTETIIPITIEIDSNPTEESNESKIVRDF